MRVSNYVGGQTVCSDQWFSVRDPGDISAVVADVSEAGEHDVTRCIEIARRAQHEWRLLTPDARAMALMAAADRLAALEETLAITLSREQGMLLRDTRRDARNGVRSLSDAARIGPGFCKPTIVSDHTARIEVAQNPYGVVAAIIPWNAPMSLAMGKIGPALATGNTIIIKPSPLAPVALTEAVCAIADCFPRGVVNVVHGTEAGKALVRHRDIRKIAFTGSIATGQTIMASAATCLKSMTMELGGNDPALVLDDADPDRVAEPIFRQAFARSGQVCYAIKRVYVPNRHYRKLVDALVGCAEQRTVGYGRDPQATLAPVISSAQQQHIDQLAESARASGADVISAGQRAANVTGHNGYYLNPRIACDVPPTHPLVTEEQFGPVLPVIPYDRIEEAIALCNGTIYGLGASVWGADTDRAYSVLAQIESGVGFINSHSRTPLGDREMPFGGTKCSGLGRNRTAIGLREFTETRAISVPVHEAMSSTGQQPSP